MTAGAPPADGMLHWSRWSLERIGIGALVLAVATSSWNAVAIGPVKMTHLALAPAIALLLLDAIVHRRRVALPSWVWLLGATIVAVCVLTWLWPPDPSLYAHRYTGGLPDSSAGTTPGIASVIGGLKWLVAVVALPVAVCLCTVRRPQRARTLVVAWMIGTTVSAAAAITDQLGLTHLGGGVLTSISFDGRQAGLSIHPNHVALAIVLALPVAVWCIVRSCGAARVGTIVAVGVMVGGLLVSGSRAGYVGAVLVILLALIVEPRTRKAVPLIGIPLVVAGAVVAVAMPGLVRAVGQQLRLLGDDSAAASDAVRAALARQALADFHQSPVFGIGFEILPQGHDIYLQLLASGGLLLVVGFTLAQGGFLLAAWRVDDGGSGLGRALGAGGVTFLVVGVVANQLADVFVAVPFAVVAGLVAAARRSSGPAPAALSDRSSVPSATPRTGTVLARTGDLPPVS